jgi:hypothetical protein
MAREIKVHLEVVSFMDEGYHLFLLAKMENHELRMLVDTGASRTVIDRNFLMEKFPAIKLEENQMSATFAGTNSIKTEIAEIPCLKFGNGKKRQQAASANYQFAVMDLKHVNETYALFGHPSIQGVVGSDLLVHFHAVINVGKRRLKLHRPGVKK